MALQDDINYLNETKSLIKQAIISKGQEISDTDTFRSYVDKINNIVGNSVVIEDTNTVQNLLSAEDVYQINIPSGVTVLSNWLYEYEITNNQSYSEGAESILSNYTGSVVIPSTVTQINAYALSCSTGVTIWIPSSVTTIDPKAFGDVSYDTSFITIYTDAPESIGWSGSLPAHVTVNYNSTYDEFLDVTRTTTVTISFDYTTETNYGTKQNNESYRPLKLNVYRDGTLITSGYLPLSVEVEKGSTVTIDHPTVFPEGAEIYTSDDINSDVYASFDLEEFKYNFSYIATDSASFYIDSTGHVK